MNKIFISYARKDADFAKQLEDLLEKAGAEVWLDVEDIRAGIKWSDAIQQGLDSAELMLLIVSEGSMKSSNVADEWQYYHSAGKPIIPVLLEKVALPFQLQRLQWVDFTNPQTGFLQTYPKLIAELNRNGFNLQTPLGTAPYQIKAAAVPTPSSASIPSTPADNSNLIKWGGIAALVIFVAVIGFALLNSRQQPQTIVTSTATNTSAAAVPTDAPSATPQTISTPASEDATATIGSVVQSPPITGGSLDVSLAYSDADSMTIVVKGDSDFAELALKSTTKTIVLAEVFDALQFDKKMAAGSCLRFVRSGQTPPLPRACDSAKTFVSDTANADVFWYDLVANRLVNLVLMRGDQQIGLCSSAVAAGGGCNFKS